MKTALILYAIYFFACYFFETKPTAEGIFLPIVYVCDLGNYTAIREDKEVNIYLTKEQIERLSEAVEEMEYDRD